jgi:hypothetical protein
MTPDFVNFLDFCRNRVTDGDEPLPAAPEDVAATIGWQLALIGEFSLAQQALAVNGDERRAERKRAALDGFRRRARGAPPAPASTPAPRPVLVQPPASEPEVV